MSEIEQIKDEMLNVIYELKKNGIENDSKPEEVIGLGDIVESVLIKFGITEERFKQWFSLQECGCSERKKYLNNLFSWRYEKKI